jgi:hypothetical protein
MEIASITTDNSAPANVFLTAPLCKNYHQTLTKVKFMKRQHLVNREVGKKNHKETNFKMTRVHRGQANLY